MTVAHQSPDQLPEQLQTNDWFAGLNEAIQHSVIVHGRTVTLAAGQTAYLQGDENTGLWLVLDGALRLELPVGDDRDVLIAVAPARTMFGRTRAGGAQARIVSARAIGPTTALILSDRAIERIAATEPAMWRALIAALHQQVDTLLASVAILLLPPPQRIAARLKQMAQDGTVHIRQSDLADLCGLSRKSVNGHVQALTAAGIVTPQYGAIVIHDMARLRMVAER